MCDRLDQFKKPPFKPSSNAIALNTNIKPTASLGLLELTSEDLLVQAEGDPAQVQAVVAVHLTA